MSPLLDLFISESFTPELRLLIKDSLNLLESMTIYKDYYAYENIIDNTQSDNLAKSDQVLNQLNSDINEVLQHHLTTLFPDTPLRVKYEIINVFSELQKEEVSEDILAILENQLNPEITLSEVLAYYGNHPAEYYLEYIDHVKDILIQNLIDYLNNKDEIENKLKDISIESIQKAKANLLTFNEKESSDNLATKMTTMSAPYIQEISFYITQSGDYFDTLLKKGDVAQIAIDLFSLAIISLMSPSQLNEFTEKFIQDHYDNPIEGRPLETGLDNLLAKYYTLLG